MTHPEPFGRRYYIVWPGIFIALSTMASSMQPKGALAPPAVDTDPHSVSPRVRISGCLDPD